MSFSVETNFPGGNACDTSVKINGECAQIAFAPDPRGAPETLWFHFKVLRLEDLAVATIDLQLKHAYNMLGGHQPRNLRPVIRYAGHDWQRLGAPEINEKPDGQFEVRWQIAAPDTSVEVAVCFPYGQTEVDSLLKEVGIWHRDEIGVGQRSTPLVRIANDYGQLESQRSGIYITARQHAGETPGSWVLDGFLRRIAELGDDAPLVWAVPLADPDGVRFGDYSKDQFPYDINRAWGHPPMRHETLAMRWDVNRWSYRCNPTLAIDFHAPGACESDGIYCFLSETLKDSELFPLFQDYAQRMESELTPQYSSPNFARVAKYRSRWETPTFAQFMAEEYNVPCISLEIPYALCGERVLSREDYREAGALICNAILGKLTANGVTP